MSVLHIISSNTKDKKQWEYKCMRLKHRSYQHFPKEYEHQFKFGLFLYFYLHHTCYNITIKMDSSMRQILSYRSRLLSLFPSFHEYLFLWQEEYKVKLSLLLNIFFFFCNSLVNLISVKSQCVTAMRNEEQILSSSLREMCSAMAKIGQLQ